MNIDKSCPICLTKNTLVKSLATQDGFYMFNCPRCGKFSLSVEALSDFDLFDTPVNRAILSYWIHSYQSDSTIKLTRQKISEILESTTLPKPQEQAEKLILLIGDSLKKPSDTYDVDLYKLISLIGSCDNEDVMYIIDFLITKGYLKQDSLKTTEYEPYLRANLTFAGWEKYFELKRSNKESRTAFMAMQFGNPTLDKIFKEIIKDAVTKTGFEIRKLDEERRAGLIDDKLRVEIRRSKFVIADLSDDNNGAYWEAGYAEGLGIPVIYICEEDKFKHKKTHFDTNHHLTLQWKDDPDLLKLFADELKATIRATFPIEALLED